MKENNFLYKWKKIFAGKRFNSKNGDIILTAEEQQELLDDSEFGVYRKKGDTCNECGYPTFHFKPTNSIQCHGCDNEIKLT